MSCEPDSNWQPQDLQSGALPLRHHSRSQRLKAIFFNFAISSNFLEGCMKIGFQHGGAGKIWANHYYGLPSEPSLNRSNFLPGGPHPSMYGYIYYTSTQQECIRHAKRVARAASGRPPDIARQSRYPPRSICLPRCRGPASIRLSLHRFGRSW